MSLRMTRISLKKVSTFCCEGCRNLPREFDGLARNRQRFNSSCSVDCRMLMMRASVMYAFDS